jgi:hypothetical protein
MLLLLAQAQEQDIYMLQEWHKYDEEWFLTDMQAQCNEREKLIQ